MYVNLHTFARLCTSAFKALRLRAALLPLSCWNEPVGHSSIMVLIVCVLSLIESASLLPNRFARGRSAFVWEQLDALFDSISTLWSYQGSCAFPAYFARVGTPLRSHRAFLLYLPAFPLSSCFFRFRKGNLTRTGQAGERSPERDNFFKIADSFPLVNPYFLFFLLFFRTFSPPEIFSFLRSVFRHFAHFDPLCFAFIFDILRIAICSVCTHFWYAALCRLLCFALVFNYAARCRLPASHLFISMLRIFIFFQSDRRGVSCFILYFIYAIFS